MPGLAAIPAPPSVQQLVGVHGASSVSAAGCSCGHPTDRRLDLEPEVANTRVGGIGAASLLSDLGRILSRT